MKEKGFTLIEILVVFSIFSILVVSVGLMISSHLPSMHMKEALSELKGLVLFSKTQAIRSSYGIIVEIRGNTIKIWSDIDLDKYPGTGADELLREYTLPGTVHFGYNGITPLPSVGPESYPISSSSLAWFPGGSGFVIDDTSCDIYITNMGVLKGFDGKMTSGVLYVGSPFGYIAAVEIIAGCRSIVWQYQDNSWKRM